ncbi:hypothetical protein BDA99DRAFT_513216 [Phascolomyces articulosus]|uniref:DNA polymerase n=1 Tax=Phascolomyces articulosus TaxID=60185 RepID=A0AAD5PCG3_9FUNG|nr:hypothetical protein BDA99DRAFT_513216 [Phascolomyces articulosus]
MSNNDSNSNKEEIKASKMKVQWNDFLTCEPPMKLYLLAIKLNNDLQTQICKVIKDQGHIVIESSQYADYIITSLKSPERIVRHVKHPAVPVVHIDWIMKENMHKDQRAKYVIDIQQYQKKRKAEAEEQEENDQQSKKRQEDENTLALPKDEQPFDGTAKKKSQLPRQVRSWYTVQDTYAKQGCKVTPCVIIEGHRPAQKYIKGDSYQTTTTDDGGTTEDDDIDLSLTPVVDNDETVEKIGTYACQRPCNWNPFNKGIVEILEFLEYARELKGDKMKSRSYRIAASTIRSYPKKIKSAKQAKKLHGIGDKTGRIIDGFLRDGYVQDVELLKSDPEFKVLETFYNVHGAGSHTAQEWYRRGRRTLDDVMAHEKLSRDQEIGIRYYDDFVKKIPRTEVEEIANEVSKILDEYYPGSTMTVCGSYRRGKPESGDVDIIMTHKENSVSSKLLVGLLEVFKVKELLVDIITMGSDCKLRDGDEKHLRPDQALCIWRQPGSTICRRVDFVVSPFENYPVAVLAWTGSSYFERSIRLYAKKVMNIKVTSHGLYSRATQERLYVKSEQHMFDILNLKWLDPSQRNC